MRILSVYFVRLSVGHVLDRKVFFMRFRVFLVFYAYTLFLLWELNIYSITHVVWASIPWFLVLRFRWMLLFLFYFILLYNLAIFANRFAIIGLYCPCSFNELLAPTPLEVSSSTWGFKRKSKETFFGGEEKGLFFLEEWWFSPPNLPETYEKQHC